jgi:hypothetical protein
MQLKSWGWYRISGIEGFYRSGIGYQIPNLKVSGIGICIADEKWSQVSSTRYSKDDPLPNKSNFFFLKKLKIHWSREIQML